MEARDPPMNLEDQIALVTGASRGIGKAIAMALSAQGARVYLCSRNMEALEAVAQEIRGRDGQAAAVRMDIRDSKDVARAVKEILGETSRVDILVNNAGITRDGLIMRMEKNDWDLVLNVNLTGAFLMCRAFSRGMLRQKEGSIVNISSVVALLGAPGQVNYVSTKAGLLGLTRSLSREFAARNIRVNAVAPGFIETEMTRDLSEKVRDDYAGRVPMKRMGQPENIADAVHFLLDDVSSYITGVVLPVDGGLTT